MYRSQTFIELLPLWIDGSNDLASNESHRDRAVVSRVCRVRQIVTGDPDVTDGHLDKLGLADGRVEEDDVAGHADDALEDKDVWATGSADDDEVAHLHVATVPVVPLVDQAPVPGRVERRQHARTKGGVDLGSVVEKEVVGCKELDRADDILCPPPAAEARPWGHGRGSCAADECAVDLPELCRSRMITLSAS